MEAKKNQKVKEKANINYEVYLVVGGYVSVSNKLEDSEIKNLIESNIEKNLLKVPVNFISIRSVKFIR